MKMESEIHYTRPPADVSAMTFDPDFQDLKCAATGAVSHTVSITTKGDRTIVATVRNMPTDAFPDFLKSFVGKSLKVEQTDDWGPPEADGSRTGTIVVVIDNAPLKLNGTLKLIPTAEGSSGTVDADIKASVPFIGSKVEKAAAPAILAAIRAEEKTAVTWFQTH